MKLQPYLDFALDAVWQAGRITLGYFQTGITVGEAQHKTGQAVVNVYVPTTPNPTSGFFLMVPRRDAMELEMSVDEGLKMIISMGVVVPKWHKESPPTAADVAEMSPKK